MSRMSSFRPLNANADVRAITFSSSTCASALMISSARPSAKYSFSGSALRLAKGRTAIDAGRRRFAIVSAFQRQPDLAHRLKTAVGHPWRDIASTICCSCAGATERRRLVADDREQDRASGIARERPRAGQHLVEHGAEAEDVRARVRRAPFGLFGRHVGRRAHHVAAGRACRVELRIGEPGDAEVEQLGDRGVAAAQHHDVGRLQIAVQDAAVVRGLDRVGDLARPAARRRRDQRTAQRVALQVLEDEVVGTDVVDLADVWMVERRNRARFDLRSARSVGGDALDRDGAIQASSRAPCRPRPSRRRRSATRSRTDRVGHQEAESRSSRCSR